MSDDPEVKIGVLGGLGPESTNYFYDRLVKICQDEENSKYPNVLINSIKLWEFVDLLEIEDKDKLVDYVNKEIEKIQDNVDFIVTPCNTIHIIIEEMRNFSKVPILGIHEEVCKEINKQGANKTGIIGTKFTSGGGFYQKELKRYDIEFETLNNEYESKLNDFIFETMLKGEGNKEMNKLLKKGIDKLKEKGCDSVILACTELPLFISDSEVDINLFSSTDILAESVIRKVFRH